MKFKHVLTHSCKADLGIYYFLLYEELPKLQVAGSLPLSVRAHAVGSLSSLGLAGGVERGNAIGGRGTLFPQSANGRAGSGGGASMKSVGLGPLVPARCGTG